MLDKRELCRAKERVSLADKMAKAPRPDTEWHIRELQVHGGETRTRLRGGGRDKATQALYDRNTEDLGL